MSSVLFKLPTTVSSFWNTNLVLTSVGQDENHYILRLEGITLFIMSNPYLKVLTTLEWDEEENRFRVIDGMLPAPWEMSEWTRLPTIKALKNIIKVQTAYKASMISDES